MADEPQERSKMTIAIEEDPQAWREDLRLRLEGLVDLFVVAGIQQEDVFAAILEDVDGLRSAWIRDPDPADDETAKTTIDEPSNDWPAAEGR